MKLSKTVAFTAAALVLAGGIAQAKPLIFPVGTVRYDPAKAFNSYVVMASQKTAKMIDRNGNLVKEWDLKGAGQAMPPKVLPGGYLMTNIYPELPTGMQDLNTVAILDWDGNIVRKFNRHEKVAEIEGAPKDANGETWVARQHHDFQIEGMSTGYYAPDQKPNLEGKMLILAHENLRHPKIHDNVLLDDVLLIVDKDENILWKWNAADHFEEMGFTDAAVEKMRATVLPRKMAEHNGMDWLHINCASWLGPNKWYDAGDKRFHPENIICDSRQSSHMFIIDHETGKIVWQVAPPFVGEDGRLGKFAGIHHTHMIPKGLPGEGNILVFDNGGTLTPNRYIEQNHSCSRIVEYDPVTKKKVWEYSAAAAGVPENVEDNFFYSSFISDAQRLPNGNTLIDEGSSNRIFEVTPDKEIVWEYINPYNYVPMMKQGITYRAYAVPYDFVPQLQKPVETAVVPPRNEVILIPDVNGNLPNYKTTIDKRPFVDFGDPAPVLTPALAKKLGVAK
ncbi:MAG: aryl-sulfate sulfotransferase [Mailhella sp.]|nr:aryl-sulfate sulfotransferase [Mailhella sp.]